MSHKFLLSSSELAHGLLQEIIGVRLSIVEQTKTAIVKEKYRIRVKNNSLGDPVGDR